MKYGDFFFYILTIGMLNSCSIRGCSRLEMKGYDPGERHWRDNSELIKLATLVDTAYSLGFDSSSILLPDTDLLVGLYKRPTVFILDSNGRVVGESICNAHFPDFKEKVINHIYELGFNPELNTEFQAKARLLHTLSGEPFSVDSMKDFTILYGLEQSQNGIVNRVMIDSVVKAIEQENIGLNIIIMENYQELGFSDFSFQRRRIMMMKEEEGLDFPKEVLNEFDID